MGLKRLVGFKPECMLELSRLLFKLLLASLPDQHTHTFREGAQASAVPRTRQTTPGLGAAGLQGTDSHSNEQSSGVKPTPRDRQAAPGVS